MTHPIVAALQPNSEQQPAITHRGADLVVTAGAGTGKTLTLVGRYLSLLADGLQPRQIIAITFTRKAAHEMRNRVRKSLDSYVRKNTGADRTKWRQLHEAMDAARIGTIHSLCSEILRAHPAEAAVDPRFSLLEEADGALLKIEAVESALAWAATNEEYAQVFALFGERDLRAILEKLLNDRPGAAGAFRMDATELVDRWQMILRHRQSTHLQHALQDPLFGNAVTSLESVRPIDVNDLMALQWASAHASVQRALSASTFELQRTSLQELNAIQLRGGRQASWSGGKEELREVKDALGTLRDWWRQLQPLCALDINESDLAFAAVLPHLQELYAHSHATYTAALRQRRALDFDDLEVKALSLLTDYSEARQRWQNEVRAILVDEYQDTNGRQRDLLNLLNGDEGKLFIVGDAKQSIYRFRGAEIAVFREERKRVATRGRALNLSQTYRAHSQLVEPLNKLLKPALGDETSIRYPWQEPFAPLVATRTQPETNIAGPFVELHLTAGSKSDGALYLAAQALAERLVQMQADSGGTLNFSDIAILCRASTSFAAYEDAFDAHGLPYTTIAGRGFFDRPEVRDVINALQAITDPLDDLALVGLLRSPVIGCSDTDLLTLLEMYHATGTPSLWQTLQHPPQPVTGEQYQRAISIVRDLHNKAGRLTIAEVLKEFLDDTAYRASLALAGQARALRNIDKLLEIASSSAFVSTADFLTYVAQLRTGITRQGEARTTAEDAIQILSVHQAKGLEFPVVIIGDINYRPPSRTNFLLDDDLGLVARIAVNDGEESAIFKLAKYYDDLQEEAESARLLYVAATRASDKLIFNGVANITRAGRLSANGGWLSLLDAALELGQTECDYDETGARRRQFTLDHIPALCFLYEPAYQPRIAPGNALKSKPRGAEPISTSLITTPPSSDNHLPEEESPRVWRVLPEEHRTALPTHLIGNLVHDALAAWRFPTTQDDELFQSLLVSRARQFGIIDKARLEYAARRTIQLLLRFQKHSLYQTVCHAERRLHEVPFTLQLTTDGQSSPIAHQVETGRIDLLYLNEEGWHIVDFKSDVIDRRALADPQRQQRYRQQLARYRQAVQALLGATPQCAVCLLDFQGDILIVDPDNWDI